MAAARGSVWSPPPPWIYQRSQRCDVWRSGLTVGEQGLRSTVGEQGLHSMVHGDVATQSFTLTELSTEGVDFGESRGEAVHPSAGGRLFYFVRRY